MKIRAPETLNPPNAPVSGAVIRNNELILAVELGQDAPNCPKDRVLLVIERYNNRDRYQLC